MKRSILVLLAAATLNIGVVGSAPAQAATPDSYSPATVVTPQHHHRHHRDGWWHEGHRHHHDDWWDDDGYDHHEHHEGHDGHDRRCEGLVVVCHLLF